MTTTGWPLVLFLLASACGGDPSPRADTAPPLDLSIDARPDTGVRDLGPGDASDGGNEDGGDEDGGWDASDAWTDDGSSLPDSSLDSEVPDAAGEDASEGDSSSADAGPDTGSNCMAGLVECVRDGVARCVDLLEDDCNCGECGGPPKPTGRFSPCLCWGGVCVSDCGGPGTTYCPPLSCVSGGEGYCANLGADANNCGGCGIVCPPERTCQMGSCVAP